MSTTNNTFTESPANLAETAIMASASPSPAVPLPTLPADDEQHSDQECVLQPDELEALLSPASALEVECDLSNLDASPDVTEADDEACEKQAIELEVEEFVGQIPPPPPPPLQSGQSADCEEQDERVCDSAKQFIMRQYAKSIIAEYLQGKYLRILQKERAKPGSGTYVADLQQLRDSGASALSVATAYRRMARYSQVRKGLTDLFPIPLSQREKDAWGIEELSVDSFEDALVRQSGDEFTTKFSDFIKAANDHDKGGDKDDIKNIPTFNMQFFGLSDDDKKTFRDAFKTLRATKGDAVASKIVLDAVCQFASVVVPVEVKGA